MRYQKSKGKTQCPTRSCSSASDPSMPQTVEQYIRGFTWPGLTCSKLLPRKRTHRASPATSAERWRWQGSTGNSRSNSSVTQSASLSLAHSFAKEGERSIQKSPAETQSKRGTETEYARTVKQPSIHSQHSRKTFWCRIPHSTGQPPSANARSSEATSCESRKTNKNKVLI